jgi:hypothetical protein
MKTPEHKRIYEEHFAKKRFVQPEDSSKKPEEKEPEKPKALTAWDVKAEGNSIASKLRSLNVKTRRGYSVGPIKVDSVSEEGDGFLIEMYAEDLKIGGPDDNDNNDSLAESKLLDEGEKIVQEKFPNHEVHPVSSEKGYFGFAISPKKEKTAAMAVSDMIGGFFAKAGTREGAKKGWETRRAGGAVAEDGDRVDVGRLADAALAVRDNPKVLAATKMGEEMFWGESKVPASEGLEVARERAEQALKMGEEALKYSHQMNEEKAKMIRWEIDAIRESLQDADMVVSGKDEKEAQQRVGMVISAADSMSLWVADALRNLKQ